MNKIYMLIILFLIFFSCVKENPISITENSVCEIYPNPVLSPLSTPSWMKWQTDPCVLKVDEMWLMYFGCNDYGIKTQIGMATSSDGITWIPHTESPVLYVGNGDSWDNAEVETPWVIYDKNAPIESRFKMWYAGNGSVGLYTDSYQIGYAYSSDGINWTKYNDTANDNDPRFNESDPILPIPEFIDDGNGQFIPEDLSSPWDAWTTGEPSVFIDDGKYKLYYIGLGLDHGTMSIFDYRVMLAESTDGINWNKIGVVFEPNHTKYEITGIMCPAVIKTATEYKLFYTMVELDHNQFANIERGVTGLAISNDGYSFTRSGSAPIIKHGPKDFFYQSGAFAATPVLVNDSLYIYFSGLLFNENPPAFYPSIGFAEYTK